MMREYERFMGLAAELMRAALDSWRAGNRRFAVLHAGMGCEHALKAVLCKVDPTFISDRSDRAFKFHAHGFGDQPGVPPLIQGRTIGLADSFKDASVVMQGRMPVSLQDFNQVIDDRNGVAHSAYHVEDRAGKTLSVAIKVAEATRKHLSVPSSDFWGDYELVFGDLAQVASLAAVGGGAAASNMEEAAETLARTEAAYAVDAVVPVVTSIVSTLPRWGSMRRSKDHQREITESVLRASVCTALSAVSRRAQQAAEALLAEHGLLPLPPEPHVPWPRGLSGRAWLNEVIRVEQPRRTQAANVLTVRLLVSRAVTEAFFGALRPNIPEGFDKTPTERGWYIGVTQPSAEAEIVFDCPGCSTPGMTGELQGQLEFDDCGCADYCSHPERTRTTARFERLHCPACSLTLTDPHEIEAAGFELSMDWDE
ncbi:hypothetical protein [Kitasatospora sp. NPDC057500]|uniref:hypothetical protein n=1 Tax=Kitasatospora sp. NPDC057500 TaxID=3346151 RepID=UPI00367C4B4B